MLARFDSDAVVWCLGELAVEHVVESSVRGGGAG